MINYFCSTHRVCDTVAVFPLLLFIINDLVLNKCAIFVCVCVPPQTFADTPPMGSSVPQLLEDPAGSPGRGSPVSNPASANTATNPESVSHSTDLQVCVSLCHSSSLSPLSLPIREYLLFSFFLSDTIKSVRVNRKLEKKI